MTRLTTLDHLVLTVSDIEATTQFYTEVLGMRTEIFTAADGSMRHALFFGRHKINLHEKGQEFEPKSAHPTPGSADLCFVSETGLSDWLGHIAAFGVNIEEGPVPRSGARGAITSIYLRDPDANLIEISTYDS